MALADSVPPLSMSKNERIDSPGEESAMSKNGSTDSPGEESALSKNGSMDSPGEESPVDWMAAAIPIDNAMTLTAAVAGNISDEDASSRCEYSPRSVSASDTSEYSQLRELAKDGSKNVHTFDDCASETSDNRSNGTQTPDDGPFRSNGTQTPDDGLYRSNGAQTPDDGPYICQSNQSLDCLRSFESLFR